MRLLVEKLAAEHLLARRGFYADLYGSAFDAEDGHGDVATDVNLLFRLPSQDEHGTLLDGLGLPPCTPSPVREQSVCQTCGRQISLKQVKIWPSLREPSSPSAIPASVRIYNGLHSGTTATNSSWIDPS